MGGLYFAAVALAMVVGLHYLQAKSNGGGRGICHHVVGISAIAVFFNLIFAGPIIFPRWLPVAAVAFGATAQAILEEYGFKGLKDLEGRVGTKVTTLSLHRWRHSRWHLRDDGSRDSAA